VSFLQPTTEHLLGSLYMLREGWHIIDRVNIFRICFSPIPIPLRDNTMKTKLLAGMIATCFAMPVLAQSTVTIYGIADAGIQFSRNGGSDPSVKLVSGIADGSRIGFKGNEDLGGGYRAVFTLEARVEFDTGRQQTGNVSGNQGFALTKGMEALGPRLLPVVRGVLQPAVNVNTNNALFDRTSQVGIITPYGAILAGRQYTNGYEVFAIGETFELGTAGNWGNITGGTGGLLTAGTAIRSDKSIQYRIAKNGFGAAIMYGFKNSGYVGLDDRFISGNVTYNANGLNVGIGYNNGTDQNRNSGLITTTLAGSYAVGNFKFFSGYQRMKNEHSVLIPVFTAAWDANIAPTLAPLGAATAGALRGVFTTNLARNFKLDAESASIGMHYRVGSGRFMGSISYQNDKTASNSDVTQYAIGYDYDFSKRTDLYTVLGYIKNKNDGQYAPGAASASGGFTGSPGEAGKALQVGIRHRF
jgi:predicted porin